MGNREGQRKGGEESVFSTTLLAAQIQFSAYIVIQNRSGTNSSKDLAFAPMDNVKHGT